MLLNLLVVCTRFETFSERRIMLPFELHLDTDFQSCPDPWLHSSCMGQRTVLFCAHDPSRPQPDHTVLKAKPAVSTVYSSEYCV
jgi:hypothetical protein